MKTYKLVNPSDPYTFQAPNIKVAGMAAAFVSTNYGAVNIDGTERSPVLFGWDEWMKEQGITSAWIETHKPEIATALESFIIGSERPAEPASEDDRAAYHDKHRTSLNDIGRRAAKLAKQLRD